jgi:hypothetical protein
MRGTHVSGQAVANVVWDILKRPHHRSRWGDWTRPGAVRRRIDDEEIDGAQSAIAWVVDDHRYDGIRDEWRAPNSTPPSRSAVQRFFRQGARPLPSINLAGPIEGITRSRILMSIIEAFAFSADELDEVRAAFATGSDDARPRWHMGHSLHTWELASAEADLKGVVQLSRHVIGGSAGFKPSRTPPSSSDIAPLRARLDTRPDTLELCLRQNLDDDSETLVGYLLAYPLTPDLTGRILAGDVDSADRFTENDIATTVADEASIYVGMVLGADLAARASVMERCIDRVTRWYTAHPDGIILAKRSTDDGGRWLENYGFSPVASPDGIWMRDPAIPATRRRKRRLIATA